MMKSLLTEQDIRYLLEQQERLDLDIRDRFDISDKEWQSMDDEHLIALKVEIHEFINACYQSWKYWKKKPMDRSQILDEAIDVIHFVMLHMNKSANVYVRPLHYHVSLMRTQAERRTLKSNSDVKHEIEVLTRAGHVVYILTSVLRILDFYDFDRKQIMQAYKDKNKVNFERLEAGY